MESNESFNSADSDSEKYAKMFPDSEIAKRYKQKQNKVRYMIQFGIAPVIQDTILDELRGQPFCFMFDETTTSQIKKQYDGYATYHSKHFGRIITTYLGTLFVGKCIADDLLHDLYTMMEKLNLDVEYIISLGMDGPNVNKSFERKLNSDLEKGKDLMCVGTCSLHAISNAFLEGLKALLPEIDLNQFAIDLHSFFKIFRKRNRRLFFYRDRYRIGP